MKKSMLGILLATGLLLSGPSQAKDNWPDRPIHLVVGFAPGGNTDSVARLLASRLSDVLKQSVVVENRAGAGGVIATNYVATAKPDGYTLLMSSTGPHLISPQLGIKVNYDPIKSFVPISNINSTAQVLLVNPSVQANTVQELIDYAKKNPGKLNFASSGPGGTMHLAGESFKAQAQIDMTHIPFRGGAPATLATVTGDTDLVFANMSDALPQMKANKVKALGVTSKVRQPQVPDLPTIAESGLPNYENIVWNGVIAPAGTPDDVVQKLSSVIQKVVAEPSFQKSLEEFGSVAIGDSSEEFAEFINQEVKKWGEVIKVADVQVN